MSDRLDLDTEWMERARCKGVPTELFFVDRGDNYAQAKALCGVCPVRQECFDYAQDNIEEHGLWGGMSARARRGLRGNPPGGRRPQPIKHGTNAGYHQHKNRGEDACQSCREAHSAYQAERKDANRDAVRRHRERKREASVARVIDIRSRRGA